MVSASGTNAEEGPGPVTKRKVSTRFGDNILKVTVGEEKAKAAF